MPAHPRSLIAIGATLLGACDRLKGEEERGPQMVVEWTGSDTGRMVAPVRVEWCDSLRMLEIRAVHGDTGIALAVYPEARTRADSYPVVAPDRADTARPAAAVALRWFAETAIKGFRGQGGAVVISRADDRVTGRVASEVRSVNDDARLDLQGTFEDVPVRPATRGCGAPPRTEPGDSGVD